MHPWRPVTLFGVVAAAISMLFPFATLPVLGILNGIDAAAWPALIPLLPVALVALIGDWDRGLRPGAAIVLVVAACLGVVFAVVKLIDAILAVRSATGGSLGAGAFLLVLGTLIALGGSTTALSRV